MIQFQQVDLKTFLSDYWQKKPLLIKSALPNFISPVSPEELAGLSLEEEVESRIVIQHSAKEYELQNGPFDEDTYQNLPEKNWTLLVQGMDKLIPEVAELLNEFDFIPQWRIDDIMISYATEGGNVGPHFDHYDVFLLQAQGKRRWMLTAQDCNESNYIQGVSLRLMEKYTVEEEFIVEAGDILYVPPKWGHHGVGLTDDCMTYSIGYRTYRGIELWDSFGDYLAETDSFKTLYQDPNWHGTLPGQVTEGAWQQAKILLQKAINDDAAMQRWFGRFATQLDDGANNLLPTPLEKDEAPEMDEVISAAYEADGIVRDDVCRFAYLEMDQKVVMYVNSQEWWVENAASDFIRHLCNFKTLDAQALQGFLDNENNHSLFYNLWVHQYISFQE